MNCIYCHQPCKLDKDASSPIDGRYACFNCAVNYYVSFNPNETYIDIIDVWTTINQKQYLARIRPYLDIIQIYKTSLYDTDENTYILNLITELDKLIFITPDNVLSKMKTYLTFL